MVQRQRLFAYAKINLILKIIGKRTDGYHELHSIMQTIALHDVIDLSLEGDGITCYCGELSGPENLAYLAAKVFQERLGRVDGITLRIEKKIPVQAGLAGGSSDAAAVLKGLNTLYGNVFTREELLEMSKPLGADVPYFLMGGTVWASGRGDDLEKLPDVPELHLVLVKPIQGVDTTRAYGLFDGSEQGQQAVSRQEWENVLQAGSVEQVAALLTNDLETASIKLVPEIAKIKQKLSEHHCLGTLMSGSGSAVFGITPTAEAAVAISDALRREGFQVWQTKTVPA